jgi:mutator protein MutT
MSSNAKPRHRVAIAAVARDGRWLVAKRRADAHLGGLWEFPGGKCEGSESLLDTAVRELVEECGVRAEPIRVLTTLTHDYGDRVVELTPILCRWISGEGDAIGNDSCRWVSADELRALPMPAMNAAIVAELLACGAGFESACAGPTAHPDALRSSA